MCFVIVLVSFLSVQFGGYCSQDKLNAGYRNDGSDKCGGIPMDSLITAAARALAAGDPLGALKRVALRDDAPALALRGIAMAQLGDLARAKALLRSAARAFHFFFFTAGTIPNRDFVSGFDQIRGHRPSHNSHA